MLLHQSRDWLRRAHLTDDAVGIVASSSSAGGRIADVGSHDRTDLGDMATDAAEGVEAVWKKGERCGEDPGPASDEN